MSITIEEIEREYEEMLATCPKCNEGVFCECEYEEPTQYEDFYAGCN